MQVSKIVVSESVKEQYPGFVVSWFEGRRLRELSGLDIDAILQRSAAKWTGSGLSGEAIGQHPSLAPWRAAFARQGVKPAKYRSSVEALVRRFASSSYRPVGIPIVDLYNGVSAFHEISMGAYDLDRIGIGNISLRFDEPGDEFLPLGGSANDYFFNGRIPVYATGSRVIAWCFNHRDSCETTIETQTSNALFVSESVDTSHLDRHRCAVEELRCLLEGAGVELSSVSWSS